MADNYTPTPIKTKNPADVSVTLADKTGVNNLMINAASQALTLEHNSGSILSTLQTMSVNTDIRDLTSATDNVEIRTAAGVPLNLDGAGDVQVDIKTDQPLTLADDAVKISANATANAIANPIAAQLSDGTAAVGTAANPLIVSTEGASNTLIDSGVITSTSVAAGASADLDSAVVNTGSTGRLLEITCSSSVRTKVELGTFNGTSFTRARVFFVEANESFVYSPKDRDTVTLNGGTGRVYRLRVTNMDNLLAADVYGSITHETL